MSAVPEDEAGGNCSGPAWQFRVQSMYNLYPKAVPVFLTTAAKIEQWMTAPTQEALNLQRPLPNGILKIVMTGEKEDPAP